MAKLYFYYSTMNAGKSTALLQASHNYGERGMRTLVYTAKLDDRAGGRVASRIGISSEARHFTPDQDLFADVCAEAGDGPIACILIDEAQFLAAEQVRQLARVVDQLNVPVLCYGLRTDFLGRLFEGSAQLLAWADNLVELKTVCHCGRKATMVVRTDESRRAAPRWKSAATTDTSRSVAVTSLQPSKPGRPSTPSVVFLQQQVVSRWPAVTRLS
jgi:thymidine kinase